MFVSRSEAFKFAVGDVITLPCEVTHPGKEFARNVSQRHCAEERMKSCSQPFHSPDHDAVCNAEKKPFFFILLLLSRLKARSSWLGSGASPS
jgi:hypothetical protein